MELCFLFRGCVCRGCCATSSHRPLTLAFNISHKTALNFEISKAVKPWFKCVFSMNLFFSCLQYKNGKLVMLELGFSIAGIEQRCLIGFIVKRTASCTIAPLFLALMIIIVSRTVAILDKGLEKLDQSIFGKWRSYLQLKVQIYTAYAYAFFGEDLLSQDKCGDAVRACKEGISCFDVAVDFAAKYSKASGPGKEFRNNFQNSKP